MFTKVMLAHKFNAKKCTFPVAVESKLDGVRCLVVVKSGRAQAYSRAGKVFTSLSTVQRQVEQFCVARGLDNIVLEGEVFCGTFKQTVSQVRKHNTDAVGAVYTVFDVVSFPELENGTGMVYEERRSYLVDLFYDSEYTALKLGGVDIVNSVEEIYAIYNCERAAGREGVVVKSLDGNWEPKRSHAWMKIKDKQTADCEIVDATQGEGKFAGTLGALVVKYRGVLVNVGTGLTDSVRNDLWARHMAGMLTGLTAEVSYHEVTPAGSLRHPAFECIRIDK